MRRSDTIISKRMSELDESSDSAGDNQSPLIVARDTEHTADTQTMMDKIGGGWFSISADFCGIALPKIDWCFDIYSAVQFYFKAHYWYFGLTLAFALVPSFIIMWINLLFYCMDDAANKCKGGFFRLVCQFLFPAAYIPRVLDRGRIGRTCQSAKRDVSSPLPSDSLSSPAAYQPLVDVEASCTSVKVENPVTLLKEYFEQLKSEDSSLAFMFHLENVLEAGPQLLLKVFILTREEDDFFENGDGWMMIGGVVVGVASCAWRIVSTRKNRNLVRENEKNMCTEHVILFFGGHFFLIGGWFILLGVISASVRTHIFLLSCLAYVVAVSLILGHFQFHHSPLFKWDDDWGPNWNRAKNVLAFPYTVFSSLFLLPSYRMIRVDLHDFIYKIVPTVAGIVASIFVGEQAHSKLAEIQNFQWMRDWKSSLGILFLHVSSLIAFGTSWILFKQCDKFSLDPEDDSRRLVCILTSLIRLKESASNRCRTFFRYLYKNCLALLSHLQNKQRGSVRGQEEDEEEKVEEQKEEMEDSNADVLMPKWEDKKQDETSSGNLRKRHLPPKEWKNMDELLSDGDLRDDEKDAIRRKDLHWICQHMKNNLFQVLTLMLAEKGTDVNARDEFMDTPILNLCKFYFKEDIVEILELLVNKEADMKAVDCIGRTMLHHVCDRYSQHRNQKDIIDLLIKKGVPVNAKDCFGDTALHLLAKSFTKENITDTVDLLIKAGLSADAKNKDGDTALHLLTHYYKHENMEDIVKLFMKANDSVDAKNQPGDTESKQEVKYRPNDDEQFDPISDCRDMEIFSFLSFITSGTL